MTPEQRKQANAFIEDYGVHRAIAEDQANTVAAGAHQLAITAVADNQTTAEVLILL